MAARSAARGSAPDRLQRILFLLPAAGSEDGAAVEDLCDALGVTPAVLLADLAEVTGREFYLPAGRGDSLRVSWDSERVRVRTTGEFRRPPKLTAREALALGLGLRVLAGERPAEREGLLDLARRLEAGLVGVPEIEFAPRVAIEEAAATADPSPDDGPDADPSPSGSGADRREAASGAAEIRGRLAAAARERQRCGFRYVKADANGPERRTLDPYVIVSSAGRWYAVGHDPDRDAVRAFRLDRMLELTVLEERFEPDPDFDLDRYLSGAYVYRPASGGGADSGADSDAVTATVRYGPAIARWILEREGGEPAPDGSAIVEHPVSDPAWAVRHVLQYGGDAELLGPADLRARVAAGARAAEAAHR